MKQASALKRPRSRADAVLVAHRMRMILRRDDTWHACCQRIVLEYLAMTILIIGPKLSEPTSTSHISPTKTNERGPARAPSLCGRAFPPALLPLPSLPSPPSAGTPIPL